MIGGMNSVEANELLVRYADVVASGRSHNHLARAVWNGQLVRIAPGVYAPAEVWSSCFPERQHALRVYAQSPRLGDVVFSHHSAAAIHRLKLLGPWPDRVCVTVPRVASKGGRSSAAVIRRMAPLSADDIVEIDGVKVTSLSRTAIDLACALPFTDGVALIDSIRHRRRSLLTLDELDAALGAHPKRRGAFKASQALEFSTTLSDSVQESRSRVLIYELGFPRPELQFEMVCDGRRYRADFWWEDHRHWGEFDGRGKYLSPDYQNGRSADQIVIAEKQREDAIRRSVDAFSRWDVRDLNKPHRLLTILTRSGLPCAGRRMLPS